MKQEPQGHAGVPGLGVTRGTVMHVSIVTGRPLEKGQFIWKRRREKVAARYRLLIHTDAVRALKSDFVDLLFTRRCERRLRLGADVSSCYLCHGDLLQCPLLLLLLLSLPGNYQ